MRGRASNRRSDESKKEAVLAAYHERYSDFGPTLASEYLAREDGLEVAVETLRQWLRSAGLWHRRRKASSPHRRWRPRKEHRGELVQLDGSHHDWFEGRRGKAVLMVMIDDATGTTFAQFFEGETTAAVFELFGAYSRKYGLPQAVYPDRRSIHHTTRDATVDESLAGAAPDTQFGRVLRELGVNLILAGSPQAKGRVERCNGTLQDRLVKALRLKGISDLESANRFLLDEFLPDFNARFGVAAAGKADLHRRVVRGVDLDRVLSFQEARVVRNDAKAKKKMSQLDAAAKVLAEAGEAMNCQAMVEAMAKKRYWSSPNGKTPAATLYALILHDIRKGKDARFQKVDRGMFDLTGKK